MVPASEMLWDGLNALSDDEPVPLAGSVEAHEETNLAELAAATPYLRRVAAVHRAAAHGGLHVDKVHVTGRTAATMRGHERGVLSEREVLTELLGSAIDARLLAVDTTTCRLHPGAEASLITGHPLAAWGEALPIVVHGDPLAGGGQLTETAALLPLLYQYVVRTPERELEPCVHAVWREMAERADGRGGRHPSQRAVGDLLASLVALLEELGAIVWQPTPGRLGTAARTFLGAFGWTLLMTDEHGPTPAVDELLQGAGYLPAAGGYVHRDDLPAGICDN